MPPRVVPSILTLAFAVLSAGCFSMPEKNGSLCAAGLDFSREATRMRMEHMPLARPVVVVNGYRALPTAANRLARNLAGATSGDGNDFLAISYTLDTDFDRIARHVIDRVEERWPSADPEATTEVDVVAISMGGLVARWAALPAAERCRQGATASCTGKRLRVARLFTLGTPHRGARLADTLAPDGAARDMIAGSGLLKTLDARFADAGYELTCYGQMRDGIVGATRCAPPGREPIWSSGTFLMSHFQVGDNALFQADIARRLRGEAPFLALAGPPPHD